MSGDFSGSPALFLAFPWNAIVCAHAARGFFLLRRGMMSGDFSGSPALLHAFPWNAVVCAHAARAVSSFAGAKEETKKSTFGPAYVYAARTKCRSDASPEVQVQWGRPGVNRRNEARLHCRSDCSTRRCRHPVVLETHPGKIRIRCAWFQLLIQQAAFVFFCSANALYASTPTFLSSQTQSLKP